MVHSLEPCAGIQLSSAASTQGRPLEHGLLTVNVPHHPCGDQDTVATWVLVTARGPGKVWPPAASQLGSPCVASSPLPCTPLHSACAGPYFIRHIPSRHCRCFH